SRAFNLRSCRRVCRRGGSRRAEARRNRSPRCLRGTMPRCSVPLGMTTTSPCLQSRGFATKTEIHLAFQHPRDLLISVTAAQQWLAVGAEAESAKRRLFMGASSRKGPSLNSLLPWFGQGGGVRYGCGMGEPSGGSYGQTPERPRARQARDPAELCALSIGAGGSPSPGGVARSAKPYGSGLRRSASRPV